MKLNEAVISRSITTKEQWMKEKEMRKERLDKTESALKEKTVMLIEHLNHEKVRNRIRARCSERYKTW